MPDPFGPEALKTPWPGLSIPAGRGCRACAGGRATLVPERASTSRRRSWLHLVPTTAWRPSSQACCCCWEREEKEREGREGEVEREMERAKEKKRESEGEENGEWRGRGRGGLERRRGVSTLSLVSESEGSEQSIRLHFPSFLSTCLRFSLHLKPILESQEDT
jgi:hypothetical protein